VAQAGAFLSAVLVTGATGQVGGALVEELLRRGAHPRAMVRTEEQAAEFAARAVDAVVADLERPETLPEALDGVERAFLMSRDDPNQPEMEGAFVAAATRGGCREDRQALGQRRTTLQPRRADALARPV